MDLSFFSRISSFFSSSFLNFYIGGSSLFSPKPSDFLSTPFSLLFPYLSFSLQTSFPFFLFSIFLPFYLRLCLSFFFLPFPLLSFFFFSSYLPSFGCFHPSFSFLLTKLFFLPSFSRCWSSMTLFPCCFFNFTNLCFLVLVSLLFVLLVLAFFVGFCVYGLYVFLIFTLSCMWLHFFRFYSYVFHSNFLLSLILNEKNLWKATFNSSSPISTLSG